MPQWCVFAGWGLLGGFIVDGMQFYRSVLKQGGTLPQEYGTWVFALAELIRLGAGAALAVALGMSGQVTAPFGALLVGIAAPLIVEKLSQQLPQVDVLGPYMPKEAQNPKEADKAGTGDAG